MKKFMPVFFTALLLSGSHLSSFTKEAGDDPNPIIKRLSISFSLAGTDGGPSKDIEKAMVASGFDETTYNWFLCDDQYYPFSRTGFDWVNRYSWMISAHYLIGSHFSAGVIISDADIGTTFGAQGKCHLSIDYGVSTFALVISGQAYGLRVSIGPALYVVKSEQTQGIGQKVKKMGFLMDFGFAFPEKSRFFIEIRGQYRLVGETMIGPYEEKAAGDDIFVTFPSAKVNYDHWFFGGGLGIRF